MTEQQQGSPEAPSLSLGARVSGVIMSPRDTFASIVAHPRWLGVLLLTTVIAAGAMFAFASTAVGEQALMDEHIRRQEQSGQAMAPESGAQFEQFAPMMKYFISGAILIFTPIFIVVFAGLLFGYGAILGGSGTYKQVLAVFTHSFAVMWVATLVVYPLNYVRGSITSATDLSAFLPMVPPESFVGSLLKWVELFQIWQIILVAIGLSVLYRRRTGPIAWTLLGLYFVIALAVAGYRSVTS